MADPALMDNLLGRVADLAATHRLPAMYYWKMYVEAGGLMSYGPSLPERHRRAATYGGQDFAADLSYRFWIKANNFQGLFESLPHYIATIKLSYIGISLDYTP